MARSDFSKTLSSSMWDEWLALPLEGKQSPLGEIKGIFQGMAAAGKGEGAVLSSGRLWLFRRLSKLWKAGGLSSQWDFSSLLSIPPSLKGKVLFRVPEDLVSLFMGFDGEDLKPQRHFDWLRGLWGSAGSLYVPRSGYYLSFRVPSKDVYRRASVILKHNGLIFGKRSTQAGHEIILRNQGEIVTLLARLGLVKASLSLEEKAIVRSMKNRANMLVNCDSSNIRKSLEAASRQIDLARAAMETQDFDSFPEVLQTLAITRIANPSSTLEELGKLQSPPVSKSTVQYRWKKLEQRMNFPFADVFLP